jgi:glycosyltransferase involved in cell wall biosynthesis
LAFREVEAAIARCDDFVTYSEHVKWHTLVDHYQIEPHRVSVVRHGANHLDDQLIVRSKDQPGAADAFARALLREALDKSVGNRFVPLLAHAEFKFLFYASQFRPNKNIITLLRAFDHLLKRRYCGHKLILTGDPTFTPDIADFIQANNLENDVLCLHGLSIPELAACYRLADLAINPSLSEGGFPFTFSEALSVDTPVVMADIAVTAEVIGEADFYAAMTFDPYDWRSAAERIDWALEHLEDLRSCQRAFYQSVLIGRKWANVVDDYVAILDRISTPVH